MKKAKISIALFLFFFISQTSAVDVSLKSSCGDNEEPMISVNTGVPGTTSPGGHVGEPGEYSTQVCVEGATELNIRDSCQSSETYIFSLEQLDNSHFSKFKTYRYSVCGKGIKGVVRGSCLSNETEAFSVYSDDDSHAGGFGTYGQNLCLYRQPPENITIELDGLSGTFYADDQAISAGESLTLVEFPYIVAEDTDGTTAGIVSYGEFVELSHPVTDTVTLTQKTSSFLLPYFSGDHEAIEDDQEQVTSNRFMNLLSPSFSYPIPENPFVRVVLQPDHFTEGFSGTLTNSIELTVRNRGLENGNVTVSIEDTS